MVSTTLSPRASLAPPSQLPSLGSYGAYCTKQVIMWLPSGAIVGSLVVGITASIIGPSEKRPYLASSHAFSRYSREGLIMISGCCGPSSLPGIPVRSGNSESARLTLAEGLRFLKVSSSRTSSSGRCSAPRSERAFYPLVHEETVEKVGATHRHQVNEPRDAPPVSEGVEPERERLDHIGERTDAGIWRPPVEKGSYEIGELAKVVVIFQVRLAIPDVDLPDLLGR